MITTVLPVGTACLTACPSRARRLAQGAPLPVTTATAVKLVVQHRRHLGRGIEH